MMIVPLLGMLWVLQQDVHGLSSTGYCIQLDFTACILWDCLKSCRISIHVLPLDKKWLQDSGFLAFLAHARYYTASFRELQRMESVSRSHLRAREDSGLCGCLNKTVGPFMSIRRAKSWWIQLRCLSGPSMIVLQLWIPTFHFFSVSIGMCPSFSRVASSAPQESTLCALLGSSGWAGSHSGLWSAEAKPGPGQFGCQMENWVN